MLQEGSWIWQVCNVVVGKCAFTVASPSSWNGLPDDIKTLAQNLGIQEPLQALPVPNFLQLLTTATDEACLNVVRHPCGVIRAVDFAQGGRCLWLESGILCLARYCGERPFRHWRLVTLFYGAAYKCTELLTC